MRICVLGSGSGGNCTVVSSGDTHLLIDCGLPARRTVAALRAMGIEPGDLAGIFISHEHGDHVYGLKPFLKHHRVPVFLSSATSAGVTVSGVEMRREIFTVGEDIPLGALVVTPFPIPHDAADPCGFRVRGAGGLLAHVTDTGCLTEVVKQRIRGAHCLVIESNHDEEMLKVGPYPWDLKQRVLSRLGHLSNRALADFLVEDFDGEARTVVLAHLSLKNNHPELARVSAREALDRRYGSRSSRIELLLTRQDAATPVIPVRPD